MSYFHPFDQLNRSFLEKKTTGCSPEILGFSRNQGDKLSILENSEKTGFSAEIEVFSEKPGFSAKIRNTRFFPEKLSFSQNP